MIVYIKSKKRTCSKAGSRKQSPTFARGQNGETANWYSPKECCSNIYKEMYGVSVEKIPEDKRVD